MISNMEVMESLMLARMGFERTGLALRQRGKLNGYCHISQWKSLKAKPVTRWGTRAIKGLRELVFLILTVRECVCSHPSEDIRKGTQTPGQADRDHVFE